MCSGPTVAHRLRFLSQGGDFAWKKDENISNVFKMQRRMSRIAQKNRDFANMGLLTATGLKLVTIITAGSPVDVARRSALVTAQA
jgi:hypothetical protein